MKSKPVIWAVGLQCRPEDEDKFNKWYDEVHLPMLLKGNQVARVIRYRLASKTYEVGPTAIECPTYQTIYEFEDQDKFEAWMGGRERAAAGKEKAETWGDQGYEVVWAARYDVMNSWNA
jgi:antibiotic biosynthesis monooxygenase (ABM) superfamily enzyme